MPASEDNDDHVSNADAEVPQKVRQVLPPPQPDVASQGYHLKFVIIMSRHPISKKVSKEKLWGIDSLANKTVDNVFKEIGHKFPQRFQSLSFTLHLTEKQYEEEIERGSEGRLQEMQSNFGQEIEADLKDKGTRNREYQIEVEADAGDPTMS